MRIEWKYLSCMV